MAVLVTEVEVEVRRLAVEVVVAEKLLEVQLQMVLVAERLQDTIRGRANLPPEGAGVEPSLDGLVDRVDLISLVAYVLVGPPSTPPCDEERKWRE